MDEGQHDGSDREKSARRSRPVGRRAAVKTAALALAGTAIGAGGALGAEEYRAGHLTPTARVSPLVLADSIGSPTSILWRGNSSSRQAALTFDDGPDPKWTPVALDLLARTGAKATFFMLGGAVAERPQLARSVAQAGHEIGSHSWDHGHLTTRPAAAVYASLSRTHAAIVAATGSAPRYFRPPYGQFDAEVAWAAAKMNYSIALWSHRMTADAPLELARQNVRTATPGMIVLSHDGRGTPTAEQMTAAEWMITEMTRLGWSFVSVSTLADSALGQ